MALKATELTEQVRSRSGVEKRPWEAIRWLEAEGPEGCVT
jgi:hypothetical protein